MKQLYSIGIIALLLFSAGSFPACHSPKGETAPADSTAVDLPQIREKGEITAITLYSSTSYFQYKMENMGYEYELIQAFARSQGLKLNIKVAENVTRLTEMLENGEGDVIAYPITITSQNKKELLFCGPVQTTSQVVVQRANKGDTLLTDVTQLIGKQVVVKHGSPSHDRLINLNTELGGGILIEDIRKDSVTTEDLIEMVSKGSIPYTVSDEATAKLNKTYFWNIDIQLKISFLQRSAWAVRKSSPLLAEAIDRWINEKASLPAYRAINKRYFELSKKPLRIPLPDIKNGVVSPYDDLFKKYASLIGWDWQLLASIAYQESHFDPNVVSWAGAEGLMGIMPGTARGLGVTPHELKEPEIAIRTGVECLRRFNQGFSAVSDPQEKIKFTLASYNAGIGHIYDARKLAEKYGKDPAVWYNNVEDYIRLKRDPQYYNDPVCKHGYLRGTETYNYVREVLTRYEYYKEHTR